MMRTAYGLAVLKAEGPEYEATPAERTVTKRHCSLRAPRIVLGQ